MNVLKRVLIKFTVIIVLLAGTGFGGWTWFSLNYGYSDGEHTGYIQKFARQGWVCKTWEGEMIVTSHIGAAPVIFPFSVRDEIIAKEIEAVIGKRVALRYSQHIYVPTRCFGDSDYFISSLRVVEDLK